MNPSSRSGGGGDNTLEMLWEDGERIFCRKWLDGADGHPHAVLAVLPTAEHPTPETLNRLVHEYGLKDEIDSQWAVQPLELVRERGRVMLTLQFTGGEPLQRLIGHPMEI